jgi:hypothetical protein
MATSYRRTPGSIRTDTSALDDILKGEIMTRLPKEATPEDVDQMLTDARRRFGKANGLWTIGAVEVEHLSAPSRLQLQRAFEAFHESGGTKVVVITTRPTVSTAFRVAAFHASNLEIVIVKTVQESGEVSKRHRETLKKL